MKRKLSKVIMVSVAGIAAFATILGAQQQQIRTPRQTPLPLTLDYSKMESSKLELESKPFAVKRCVEETFDLLAAKAAEKNLRLVYTMHRNVPTFVYGDITRLRQVLLNLVSNAIKFTPSGSVEIEATASQSAEGGGKYTVQFEVRDTGIGIPADRIDRLFTPYAQAGADTSPRSSCGLFPFSGGPSGQWRCPW